MSQKKYLIGSYAIALQDTTFKLKSNSDIDVISDEPIDRFEFHDISFLNNSDFSRYALDEPVIINNVELYPINMKGLAIIKRSHLWRDLKFDRHIAMYHRFLSPYLNELDDVDKLILTTRTEMSYKEFGKIKSPSLKKTVNDFFDDYVIKKYDHDYLHELLAYYDKPLYTRLQRDSSIVWCEKDLWDTLSYEDKCKCVAEETYVIAIERFMVPSNWTHYIKLSYIKALQKVCTTLTSGWFRDFAIDNYPQIIELFDENKFNNTKLVLLNKI